MPNEQIGLIIWGCKGGHRVFCSNDVVDHREPVIKDTLKDIRSFVRFNQNKINSFALEFTDRYKIYTVYRSCNDNGTGAYVAIIVYVPHAIRIANIRQVLTKMMDKYFEEYVHPLYGTYIPGKYDDIKPFSDMLSAAKVEPEQRRARVMPSTQDNTPNVRLYTDITEVDEFFDTPYRPEFFACQEVMFLDKSIYDKIPDTLQFQMPPRIIERVSPPEPLPAIDLSRYDNLKTVIVNGTERSTVEKIELNDSDDVKMVFTKPYHEDIVLTGKVGELKSKRYLNDDGKTITLGVLRFIPREYTVKVNLNETPAPESMLRVWFENGGEKPVMHSEIQVSGADVHTPLHWAVKAAPKGGWIEAKSSIKLKGAIDSGKPVELATVTWPFTVEAGDVRSKNLRVELGRGVRLSFPLTGNPEGQISITVPKGEYSSKDFLFSADDALVREADGVVTIEPKPEEYTLEIPGVKRFWDNWDWDFKMDGSSYRAGNDKIRLASGQKLSSGKGRLTINGMEFEYAAKNDVVTPYAVVVRTNTMVAVDVNGETYDVSSIAIFPDRAMPRVIDTEKYEVDHNTAGPVQEMRVSLKGNSYNPGGDIGHDTPSNDKQIQVTFINCKGFVIESRSETISRDRDTITMRSEIVRISNKKSGKRCKIYRDDRKYKSSPKVAQENQADGFTVRYDDYGCTVTYNGKSSGFDLPQKWIVIVSVAAAVIALAVAACLVLPWSDWFGKNTMAPIAKISFVPDSQSEYFSDKNAVIEKIAPATTLLAVKDDSIIQVMYDSRFLKKNCDGKMGVYIDSILREIVSLKIDGVQIEDYNLGKSSIRQSLFKQISDYKAMLENDGKPINLKSLYIAVNSPVRDAVKTFANEQANSPKDILFSRAKDIMHDNPATGAPIMAICWPLLEADHTVENIASFREAFGSVEGFSNYESQMDVWSKEIREKAQVEQDRADLLKDAKAQIVMLHKMTCSSTTVANVNNWWEKLRPEQKQTCRDAKVKIDNYILAYNKFFNAKGVDDMKDLKDHYLSYFSAEQQKVITQEYGKDTKAFKKRQAAANGMKFSY